MDLEPLVTKDLPHDGDTSKRDDPLEDWLPYLLQRASHLATREFHRKLHLGEMQPNRWRMLAWLSEHQPYSVLELTERLMLKQPSVTQLVNSAVKDGLITKTVDSADKRRIQIALTSEGKRVVATLKDRAMIGNAHLQKLLTPELTQRLSDDLREVLDRLE